MNRPIYIFTGLLDSGKTSSIKKTLDDARFNEGEHTLILCFEEGDEGYDKDFLDKSYSDIEYLDFATFSPETIKELDKKYNPDRIFIEFNGMDEDKKLLAMQFDGWDFAQLICIVDASKFKLHVTNMPQFMFNHISVAEIVVFNRYEGQDFKYLRTNIKSMNRGAYLNLEDDRGNVMDFPVSDIFDRNNLDISDDDYGLFYMDVLDNFIKYKDAELKIRAFCLEKKDDLVVFGRIAMVCCANDTQRLAINVKGLNENLEIGTYYEVSGTLKVEREGAGYRLHVDGKEAKKINKPEKEYVSFY